MSTARLRDSACLADLRRALALFRTRCAAVLGQAGPALMAMDEHLRLELARHWQRELIRREEAWQEARRAWLAAADEVRHPGRGPGRASAEDERVAMDRARTRRDQAEERLASIRTWVNRLSSEGGALAHRCRSAALALDDDAQRAIATVDALEAAIATYQVPGPTS